MFNESPIAWRSKELKSVATSTAAAGYMSAFFAPTEIVWARNTCAELEAPQSSPTTLYEDTQACIVMANSLMIGDKAKHIEIRLHFLRELVAKGIKGVSKGRDLSL